MENSRDDRIRTCDHTPPRRVRYRTALHPDTAKIKNSLITLKGLNTSLKLDFTDSRTHFLL